MDIKSLSMNEEFADDLEALEAFHKQKQREQKALKKLLEALEKKASSDHLPAERVKKPKK